MVYDFVGWFVFVAYCLMVNSRLVIVSFFVFRCSSVGRARKPGKKSRWPLLQPNNTILIKGFAIDTFFETGDHDFKLGITTLNWIFTTSTSKW